MPAGVARPKPPPKPLMPATPSTFSKTKWSPSRHVDVRLGQLGADLLGCTRPRSRGCPSTATVRMPGGPGRSSASVFPSSSVPRSVRSPAEEKEVGHLVDVLHEGAGSARAGPPGSAGRHWPPPGSCCPGSRAATARSAPARRAAARRRSPRHRCPAGSSPGRGGSPGTPAPVHCPRWQRPQRRARAARSSPGRARSAARRGRRSGRSMRWASSTSQWRSNAPQEPIPVEGHSHRAEQVVDVGARRSRSRSVT